MPFFSGTSPGILIRTEREYAERFANRSGALEAVSSSAQVSGATQGWLAAPARRAAHLHPWDEAHAVFSDAALGGLESAAPVELVEPDFVQAFPVRTDEQPGLESADVGEPCRVRGLDPDWPPAGAPFGWHLADEFSGLRSAREAVGEPTPRLLVGILDTGFDPHHSTLPRHLRLDLARNLTGSGAPGDASDPASSAPFTNPGHGTATLALLAGNRINPSHFPHFDDFLGGAPHVEVVPIRIADSVVHFRTSAMAAGIHYAAQIGCQVLSISMGGVPSAAWAEAVNRAYEAGVAIFAAGGNRIGPLPPSSLVYPARFERVVAVCGFTAAKQPYLMPGFHRKMHGCFGPDSAMGHAIAAYTPNMPWAAIGCGGLVNPDGAGTSSATPQAAAAAALWLQKHGRQIAPHWRRVEAVRYALFQSADRSPPAGRAFFGNGLLRARQALEVPFNDSVRKSPAAEVAFPWLRLLGAFESAPLAALPGREQMFEVEALQLYFSSPRLQATTGAADPHHDRLDSRALQGLLAELGRHPNASQALRARAAQLARARTGTPGKAESPAITAGSPLTSSYLAVSRLFRPAETVEAVPQAEPALAKSFTAVLAAARNVTDDPQRLQGIVAEVVEALRRLKAEGRDAEPGIMSSPQDQLAAVLQTVLTERAARPAGEGGLEFTFDEADLGVVMREVLQRVESRPKHPPMRPDSSEPEPLSETARLGLVGDFGTGLYGAPVTAATLTADPGRFDLLVHLGDVYYSGEKQEVQTRLLDVWPKRSDAVNRSLNGNHDMYSGGYGYFDLLLARFGQKSSYFAMQNQSWTLMFLDTAYEDKDLDRKQVKWISKVVEQAGRRKVALFSHHPLFSNFKKPGVKLAAALHELLEARRVTVWYWGHEHHCIIYERHPVYGLFARCLGNGGMPAKRKEVADYPVEREGEGFLWRRIDSDLTPSGLILDGPNPDIPEAPHKYLPHSFMTLEFTGARLHEAVFSPRGQLLYSGEIE